MITIVKHDATGEDCLFWLLHFKGAVGPEYAILTHVSKPDIPSGGEWHIEPIGPAPLVEWELMDFINSNKDIELGFDVGPFIIVKEY